MCTCLCAVQVTVLSKGSLIIVGAIMEISVSSTIGADDRKKNYLFWSFCSLISCPLATLRDFYYRLLFFHVFFLFDFCLAFLHRSVHPHECVCACPCVFPHYNPRHMIMSQYSCNLEPFVHIIIFVRTNHH